MGKHKCVDCNNEFPDDELYLDGEDMWETAQCWFCMVKEAQKIFGSGNVLLPPSMLN